MSNYTQRMIGRVVTLAGLVIAVVGTLIGPQGEASDGSIAALRAFGTVFLYLLIVWSSQRVIRRSVHTGRRIAVATLSAAIANAAVWTLIPVSNDARIACDPIWYQDGVPTPDPAAACHETSPATISVPLAQLFGIDVHSASGWINAVWVVLATAVVVGLAGYAWTSQFAVTHRKVIDTDVVRWRGKRRLGPSTVYPDAATEWEHPLPPLRRTRMGYVGWTDAEGWSDDDHWNPDDKPDWL